MARTLLERPVETSFDKGIKRFTWLMIVMILVMTPIVFLLNLSSQHGWRQALFFALAVAVGLAPEMLPMIMTVCLSKGAMSMSKVKVIVKRLHSIQNLGSMDVLCTDKTGTLTIDRVILEKHCDVVRNEDEDVLRLAYMNSHFQTGLRNVLDRAILSHRDIPLTSLRKVDEIPFDFTRKIMSVVIELDDGRHRLICKGAPEEIIRRCRMFELNHQIEPIYDVLIDDLQEEHRDLGQDGFRVLAIAYRDFDAGTAKAAYSKSDETDLVLKGYLAFLDPPKDSTTQALSALAQHGVTVKVLTGDNELVTRKICHDVGLEPKEICLGSAVAQMSDEQLAGAAERANIFARLAPLDKQRIVLALRGRGHVVGFLGDGINDAPALRAADVGISVDTATDIARESADMILLEKSLMVLEHGVLEGRRVFANIIKYVKMGASSNFGNMLSVVGASAFLPFLPMLPLQVLMNNLLYDFSQVPIPTDMVDPEFIACPRNWTLRELTRFILLIGPVSSIFDYTTFAMMLLLFGAWGNPALFQTGWFVESLLTQTLIIHIIRTNKIPIIQSRPSWQLVMMTLAVMATGLFLAVGPAKEFFKFVELPALYWPLLGVTLVCYVLLAQTIKSMLVRMRWV